MFEALLTLVILFAVIIDPPLSFAFFISNTKNLSKKEKVETALKAIALAFIIVFIFVLFGDLFLRLFSIELNHLRIAGGLILLILGVKMTLGLTFRSSIEEHEVKDTLPTIIATPLISGPACITTILISSVDYGKLITGVAVGIVLFITGAMLLVASYMKEKHYGKTAIKMITTSMGLVTVAWGISFIMTGLGL